MRFCGTGNQKGTSQHLFEQMTDNGAGMYLKVLFISSRYRHDNIPAQT